MKPKDDMIVSTSLRYFLMFIVSIKEERGDRFDVLIVRGDSNPGHGVALSGALPNDHGFTILCQPYRAQAVGVVHVRCPVATMRIKGAPCLGLDCDGVCHVLSVCR